MTAVHDQAMNIPAEQQVALAFRIAAEAHRGQVDKAGHAYISHPARVAARLVGEHGDQVVAWLHDVIEDSDFTADDLIRRGIDADLVHDVVLLTRQPGQSPADYYAGIRTSERALRVKRADIADNSDPERLKLLDATTADRLRRKYAAALEALGA